MTTDRDDDRPAPVLVAFMNEERNGTNNNKNRSRQDRFGTNDRS
jgi:hypothetical protein